MKKLLFLFSAALLLVACGDDDSGKPDFPQTYTYSGASNVSDISLYNTSGIISGTNHPSADIAFIANFNDSIATQVDPEFAGTMFTLLSETEVRLSSAGETDTTVTYTRNNGNISFGEGILTFTLNASGNNFIINYFAFAIQDAQGFSTTTGFSSISTNIQDELNNFVLVEGDTAAVRTFDITFSKN